MDGAPLPQGPMKHCDNLEPHDKHPRYIHVEGTWPMTDGVTVDDSWCDGVPPLKPFVELLIRVDLELWGGTADGRDHQGVLEFLEANGGLGVIVDAIGSKHSSVVLRVRTEDLDKAYPIIKRAGVSGLAAVVMPDERPL